MIFNKNTPAFNIRYARVSSSYPIQKQPFKKKLQAKQHSVSKKKNMLSFALRLKQLIIKNELYDSAFKDPNRLAVLCS